MEKNELFDFKYDKRKNCYFVTGYNGKGEEMLFPAAYKEKPVKSIGNEFFINNKRIKRVTIPEGYTYIGELAFLNCTALTEISVEENNPVFRSIDGVLFDKEMTTLMVFPYGRKGTYSIPEGIINIRSGAFFRCNLSVISFPQSLLTIKDTGFNNEQLTEIAVNGLNPFYCSIDGVLFDKETIKLLVYPRNKENTDYTVPDEIKIIDEWAFRECKHLVNILLPESLEFILAFAFEKCKKLKTVTLPMNLQFIGELAFYECPNLETVTLSRKTKIGYRAFDGFKGQFVYTD